MKVQDIEGLRRLSEKIGVYFDWNLEVSEAPLALLVALAERTLRDLEDIQKRFMELGNRIKGLENRIAAMEEGKP